MQHCFSSLKLGGNRMTALSDDDIALAVGSILMIHEISPRSQLRLLEDFAKDNDAALNPNQRAALKRNIELMRAYIELHEMEEKENEKDKKKED
jgi:hypothetical protein